MPNSRQDKALEKRLGALADEAQAARERADQLDRKLEAQAETIAALKASTSWRVTAPLRAVSRLARRLRRGAPEAAPGPRKVATTECRTPTRHDPAALFGAKVVIVAELSLAQCAKYRVWQKQAAFERLGVPCTVVAWSEHEAVRNALQTCSLAIFYRPPGYPEVLEAIEEARRLNVPTLWEADDLIFDEAAYRANRNLDHLDPALKAEVLSGVPLYRKALLACDHGLASTEELAAAMRAAGVARTFVVENGLDQETLDLAGAVLRRRVHEPRRADRVTVLYGSGSKAHDADFAEAADGVLAAMAAVPELHLRIVGSLNLPPAFDAFAGRVERVPPVDYGSYLRLLGEADINLAPLEATQFNDAKSNIKFLEAAALEIPSVCSPRAAFAGAVEDGRTGFLADSAAAWRDALVALARDEALRRSVGKAAAAAARTRYAPEAVAAGQVQPLVDALAASPPRTKLRALIVNIYFAPQSFGGATIVAEAMAARLGMRDDMEAVVFTAWPDAAAAGYALHRWEAKGVPVVGVRLPDHVSDEMQYDNPRMGRLFGDLLEALRPDVVHLHSVQGLSASLADACRAAGVPYVVTLHDSWWLCERQFMVRPDDRYCFQERLDWAVCATCVKDLGFSIRRRERLREALDGAERLLAPSAFHRALHVANGVPPERIAVQKNGIAAPARRARTRRDPDLVRFGFVGGSGPIKGLDLVRRALEQSPEGNYELVLVDNTLNIGYSSIDVSGWSLRGRIRVVPAYAQAEIDDFFAGLDVLLFPSQWKESFGLTVREALARDVWVIVTDAGGAAEDVVDGENGTIIPIGEDVAPLRDAIGALLRDPARLHGYANRHKARLVTFDEQAESLAAVLREAAHARAST